MKRNCFFKSYIAIFILLVSNSYLSGQKAEELSKVDTLGINTGKEFQSLDGGPDRLPPPPCYVYSISPRSINMTSSGGQQVVRVTTEGNCGNFLVSESLTWVSYVKSGLNVTITVQSNSGSERSGYVDIGGESLYIYQQAACPTIAITQQPVDNQIICDGVVATLSVQASGPSSYQWQYYNAGSWPNIPGATSSTYSFVASNTTAGIYQCVVSNSCNQTTITSNPGSIQVSYANVFNVSGSSYICPGGTANVTLSGSTWGIWYEFYRNGEYYGESIQGTGQPINFTVREGGTYTIKATTPEGCYIPMNGSVQINSATNSTNPTSITASPSQVCPNSGTSMTVNGGVLGTGAQWKWYTNSSYTNLVYAGNPYNVTPTANTTYYVRAEGTCNQTSGVSKTITISTPPTITQEPEENQIICNGATASLSVTAMGASSYQWQYFNGSWTDISGATSSTYSFIVTNATAGSYHCVVKNGCNQTTTSRAGSIQVSYLYAYNVSGSSYICPGSTATVTLSGSYSGIWYQCYRNGGGYGGSIQGTGQPINFTVSADGLYTVKAISPEGCYIQMNGSVQINSATNSTNPTSINASAEQVCPNSATRMTVNGGSLGTGAQWQWYDNSNYTNLVYSGESYSPVISYDQTFYVRAEGTCKTTEGVSTTITVKNPPVITQQPQANQIVCQGATASITVAATNASSYQWQYLNGTTWTDITGATSSSYSFTVNAGRSYHCIVRDYCNQLTVSESGSIQISYLYPYEVTGDTIICPEQSAIVALNDSDPGNLYQCYLNGNAYGSSLPGTGDALSFTVDSAGVYVVKGFTPEGCSISMIGSATIIFRTPSTDPESISVNQQIICQGGESVVFLTINGGSLEEGTGVWRWYTGDGPCGTDLVREGSTIQVVPTTTTTYYVRAEGGCSSTACTAITIFVKGLRITTQPMPVSSNPGQMVNFSIITDTYNLENNSNLQYLWQTSENGQEPWTDLSELSATGFNTPNLSFQAQTVGKTYYRCRVTYECGIIYSDIASLSITFPNASYISGNEIPTENGRILDNSLNVGYTQGSFTNTKNGAANYEVPIIIPQGTNGMQPKISLTYNSLGENGLLGMGWNINGLSSIGRISKPYYVNGSVEPINLDALDLYALDGNRLVLTDDSSGYEGDKFKTELETFSTITSMGISGNGPEWFEVKYKNGTIVQYGHGQNSSIKAINGTILKWNITKVIDSYGNFYEYIYKSDPTAQNYLEKITYTGNLNTGLKPYNEIHFYYEQRSDKNELFLPGLSVPQKLILTKIQCISEEKILRSYELKYTYNLTSHFVELIERDKNGSQLNSTIFDWGKPSTNYRVVESDNLSAQSSEFYTGDFNGDGNADILTTPKKPIGGFSSTDQWKLFLGSRTGYHLTDQGDLNIHFVGFSIADGDNDGDDDIFWQFHEKIEVDCPPGKIGRCFMDQNRFAFNKIQNGQMTPITSKDILFIDEPLSDTLQMYPGDFDGNGLTDYLFFNQNKNLKEIINIQLVSLLNLNSPDNVFVMDFNGDGKTDIVTLESGSYLDIYSLSSTTHSFELVLDHYNLGNPVGFGDFNGDGKTDILATSGSSNLITYIYYSTGTDFIKKDGPISADISYESYPPNAEPPFEFIFRKGIDFIINDFNSDGKSDILTGIYEINRYYVEAHFHTDTTTTREDLYLSNGLGFQHKYIHNGVGRHYYKQLDNNHDGNMDLLISWNWENNEVYEFFPDDISELLSSATDGRNLKVEFTYKSMLDSTVYTREQETYISPVFPNISPAKLLWEIKMVNNNNGLLLGKERFKYKNLKVHRQGRGSLGFSSVLSRDITTGHSNLSFYSHDDTYFYPYLALSIDSVNGNAVSELSNIQSFINFDNFRYQSYIDTSKLADKINGISTESIKKLDSSGNLISEKQMSFDSNHNIVKQVSSVYSDYNSFGLPQSMSISSTRGTETITRNSLIEYNSVHGQVDSVTHLFGESPSMVTSYNYDNFGNRVSINTTDGVKSRQTSIKYEDSKGRFPVKTISAIGDSTKFTYDALGNILTETDNSGLTTSNLYDNFGNLQQATLPDLRIMKATYYWSLNTENIGELYYKQIETTGKPMIKEYYDILGRKIRTKTQSFNGTWIQSDVHYDSKGRVENSYNPYFSDSPAEQYVHYVYDAYDRIVTETFFPLNNTISYLYNPLSITVTKDGRDFIKEYDATGQVIGSNDPGGTIQYIYNAEDKIKQIVSPSGNTIIQYDDYGFQKSLQDIDAGIISYVYNGFGELENQTDAKGNEQVFTYDALSRPLSKFWINGDTITYEYNPLNGHLKKQVSSNGTKRRFEYDALNRLKLRIDSIDNNRFTSEYNYNNQSAEIENILLNNSVQIDYQYNNYGYLNKINIGEQEIWTGNSMNKYGIINNFTLGDGTNTSLTYDQNGFLDGITTIKSGAYLQNWDYNFNGITGNLTSRTGLSSNNETLSESFEYDNLDRLLKDIVNQDTISINYDQLGYGNIINKSDIGAYDYSSGVHNLSSINTPTNLMQNLAGQTISYTKFNKVNSVIDTLNSDKLLKLDFDYGTDEERWKTQLSEDGIPIKTKYFALGQYEKEIDSTGIVRELYYISGADGLVAILEKINDNDTLYFIHKDHLGSIDVITNADGIVKQRFNFDPWGRRRNPADWSYNNVGTTFFVNRGFTAHEHLDEFNLINMNGRIYDPLLATFLSPDNYVQSPDLTLNFNRYTYALNNPLIFTDPTGNTRLPVAKERRDGGWGGFGVVASGMAFVKYGAANTFAQMGMHDAGPEFSHYSTWSENSEINSLFPSYASFEKVIQSTGGITIGRMTGVLGNYIAMEVNAAGTQTLTNSRDMYLTYEEIWIPTPINKTSDQKDDYGWAKNTQTDLGAFDVGNGAKGGLIDYAVASSAGKSMNALKRADYVATLGKTGANYVRAFKVVGVATFGASTVISASLATNYYMNGGLDYSVGIKSSVDIVMGVVGFLGPVGFGISATYFIIDAASDGFGGYGDPLKINN